MKRGRYRSRSRRFGDDVVSATPISSSEAKAAKLPYAIARPVSDIMDLARREHGIRGDMGRYELKRGIENYPKRGIRAKISRKLYNKYQDLKRFAKRGYNVIDEELHGPKLLHGAAGPRTEPRYHRLIRTKLPMIKLLGTKLSNLRTGISNKLIGFKNRLRPYLSRLSPYLKYLRRAAYQRLAKVSHRLVPYASKLKDLGGVAYKRLSAAEKLAYKRYLAEMAKMHTGYGGRFHNAKLMLSRGRYKLKDLLGGRKSLTPSQVREHDYKLKKMVDNYNPHNPFRQHVSPISRTGYVLGRVKARP